MSGDDPATPLIELIDVARRFVTGGGVEVHALRGVSLAIHPGEFVAIQGQSGSGKSTLMNLIGCLDRPTSGAYRLAGRDIGEFDANGLAWLRREVFGFVFQSYNLLPTASAEENVEVPAIYAGLPYGQRRSRALDLLASLGMADRADHRPNQLSGGQQQRVSIARALMNGGQIILADEPTGALDSASSKELLNLLEALSGEGHTVIVITHDPVVAGRADRQIEILDGRIVRDTVTSKQPGVVRGHLPDLSRAADDARTAASLGDMLEAFRMAMRSLKTNLFRTFLTLLGVMIGVMSVITMMSIGEGAKRRIAGEINQLGANRLTVFPNLKEFPEARLPFDDVGAVEDLLPNLASVLPELNGTATVRHRNVDYETNIIATAETYPTIRDWAVASGVFFTDQDSERYNPVAVLGATARDELLPYGGDPLGKYLLINKVPFLVIGTMTRKGAGGFGRYDQDDVIFVPLKTGAHRLFGEANLRSLVVTVTDSARIAESEHALRALLTDRHGEEDFRILNSVEMLESMDEAMSVATLVLGAIGAIALLVGGIGIMNIMLVSVTERTREIGIRMATGARKSDILVQFLSEAIVVSLLGGVIGIGVGMALGVLIGTLVPDVQVAFTGLPMIVAFSCAAGTGLLFGFAPARNASRMDPVVALATD
jgi:macrolide transport system ATP-binding/permease protein